MHINLYIYILFVALKFEWLENDSKELGDRKGGVGIFKGKERKKVIEIEIIFGAFLMGYIIYSLYHIPNQLNLTN